MLVLWHVIYLIHYLSFNCFDNTDRFIISYESIVWLYLHLLFEKDMTVEANCWHSCWNTVPPLSWVPCADVGTGRFQAHAVEASPGIASHSWLYSLANVGLVPHCLAPTNWEVVIVCKTRKCSCSKVGLQNYSLLVFNYPKQFCLEEIQLLIRSPLLEHTLDWNRAFVFLCVSANMFKQASLKLDFGCFSR